MPGNYETAILGLAAQLDSATQPDYSGDKDDRRAANRIASDSIDTVRITGMQSCPNSTRFHQSSIKPPKMSLNTPKPPTVKSLILLGLRVGGLGSFGLKAIRNRQVASSTLALGSKTKKTNEFLKPVTYR